MLYYVISDLHLGGATGFQMMRHPAELKRFIDCVAQKGGHLVINGDFIDFLAERHPETGGWTAFQRDQCIADKVLRRVLDRFDSRENSEADPATDWVTAMWKLDGRLTVVLGNHDVELSLPMVRNTLEERVGVTEFVMEGERLRIGSVSIEHGNAADSWNSLDHEGLQELRDGLQQGLSHENFRPRIPRGSRLVAEVMNGIKREVPFVDLLKPEGPGLILLLLALAPEKKQEIVNLLRMLVEHAANVQYRATAPAAGGVPPRSEDFEDNELIASFLWGEEKGFDPRWVHVIAGLIPDESLDRRLEVVLDATWGTAEQQERVFGSWWEPKLEYFEHAVDMLKVEGIDTAVLGHTHHSKSVKVGSQLYLNTGTWAGLMRFPKEMLEGDRRARKDALAEFVKDLTGANGTTATYEELQGKERVRFEPHFVRVDASETSTKATLHAFGPEGLEAPPVPTKEVST